MEPDLYQDLLNAQRTAYVKLDRALWSLTGDDRVRYLNGQLTNDVRQLTAGGATIWAAVTTAKGRMEGEVRVGATTDCIWIDGPLALRESLGARLDKYLIADDAELEDVTDDWQIWHLLGAAQVADLADGFCFPSARFGVAGFDMWLPAGASPPNDWGLSLGVDELDQLRIAHGLAAWGAEMDEKSLPPEVMPEHLAISYTKGCYVGQETIARIKSIGHVNRTLVVVQSQSVAAPQVPLDVEVDGKVVGRLTTCHQRPSPSEETGLWGLAVIKASLAQAGTILHGEGKEFEVVATPRQPEQPAAANLS